MTHVAGDAPEPTDEALAAQAAREGSEIGRAHV